MVDVPLNQAKPNQTKPNQKKHGKTSDAEVGVYSWMKCKPQNFFRDRIKK